MPRAKLKDVPRYASGRINQHARAKSDEAMQTVLARRAKEWRMPLNAQTRPFLADARHGYALGRANLRGQLTDDQENAGRHVWRVVEAYRRLVLGMTGHPRNATLEMLPEAVEAVDDDLSAGRAYETLAERVNRVTGRYMALQGCLMAAGRDVHRATLAMATDDDDGADVVLVRRGLDAVYKEFGLG